jgi:dual specificity MAP kinase phosphatase
MILKSKLLFLEIEYRRLWDYLYRKFTGLLVIKNSQITTQIFLGGQYGLRSIPQLKKLGITAIVNMRMRSIPNTQNNSDFRYLYLPTPDRQAPTLANLKKGVAFITAEIKKGGKVYVHCHAGEGRGPTMVLAYLISTGLVLEDAVQLIKNVRIFIRPTRVQFDQLKTYAKTI